MEQYFLTNEGRDLVGKKHLWDTGMDREFSSDETVLAYIWEFGPVDFEELDSALTRERHPTWVRSSLRTLFEAGLINKVDR